MTWHTARPNGFKAVMEIERGCGRGLAWRAIHAAAAWILFTAVVAQAAPLPAAAALLTSAEVASATVSTPALSAAQANWVAIHGPIRVGIMPGLEPYYGYGPADGVPQGFAVELLTLMATRAGLTLDYVSLPTPTATIDALRAGTIDMTPMAVPSLQREQWASFPGALLPTELVVVTRADIHDTSASQDFAGRRLALVRGAVHAELIARRYPNAAIEYFDTGREAYTAIANGQADIGVGWLHDAVYTIEANLLANLRVERDRGAVTSFFGPAVSLKSPMLHQIITQAMAELSPADRAAAARRWLPNGATTLWPAAGAALSDAETEWIRRYGEIRLGFDQSFAPFTQQGALNQFEGLGADMLRLAASKVGLRIVEQRGGSFVDIYSAARAGELNVVVGMARTAQRLPEFQFVGPFATAPTGLMMRTNDSRVWGTLEDIDGGRLGLLKSHFLLPQIRSRLPALRVSEFDTQQAVLQALADGKIDAAIGNGVVMQRLVEERFSGRLRLTGVVNDADSELYFGVTADQPELARILRKGTEAITPAEDTALRRRWLLVSVTAGLDWHNLLRWALPLGIALAIGLTMVLLANRRLRVAHVKQRAARQVAEAASGARGRFLAYLAHELRGTLGAVSSGAQMLRTMDDPGRRDALLEAIAHTCDGLRQTLETTLAHERAFATGIELDARPTRLADWWAQAVAPIRLAAQQKGLVLQVAPTADVTLIFDGPRLAQVVANLAGNAVKFTAQGQVSLRLDWAADRQRLRLTVTDTGPGIGPQEQATLFQPYAQGAAGKAARQGAGLGLAISRQIVDAMGGTLAWEPAPGRGSAFSAELPAAALGTALAAEAPLLAS